MHSVYTEQGRLTEWRELLDGIRRQHEAKRRLMEVLDNLPGGQRSRTSTRGRKPQRRGR